MTSRPVKKKKKKRHDVPYCDLPGSKDVIKLVNDINYCRLLACLRCDSSVNGNCDSFVFVARSVSLHPCDQRVARRITMKRYLPVYGAIRSKLRIHFCSCHSIKTAEKLPNCYRCQWYSVYCFAFSVRLLSYLKYHHSVCNDESVSQNEKNILHLEDSSNKANQP